MGQTLAEHGTRGATPNCLGFVQLVDVLSELRLQVCSLVLADHVLASKLVKHSGHLGHSLGGFIGVGHLADVAHGIAHGLAVITVAKTACLALTNSLNC